VLILARNTTFESKIRETAAWVNLAQRMAHKIRTPLSTILMSIEKIQRNYRTQLDQSVANELDLYADGAKTELSRLRDASRIFMQFLKRESPTLISSNIKEFVDQFLQDYKPKVPDNVSIQVDVNPELKIPIDKIQMVELFENVFDNALKSFHDGGAIKVIGFETEEVVAEKGTIEKKVLIELEDTGCGIPDAHLENLFDPYVTYSEEGIGLGLFIVQKIMQDHQGKVSIRSRENVGTTITLQFKI
jgi:two-component system nitrogen regulation sensor histidine kinase NtrY